MKIPRSLKITDSQPGTGRSVVPGDVAICHFRCTRNKGDLIFENSSGIGIPIRVGGRDCFAGLEYGLLGMRTGGQRRVVVPPNLTYDERKVYPDISERSIIIYEITLNGFAEKWDPDMESRLADIETNGENGG